MKTPDKEITSYAFRLYNKQPDKLTAFERMYLGLYKKYYTTKGKTIGKYIHNCFVSYGNAIRKAKNYKRYAKLNLDLYIGMENKMPCLYVNDVYKNTFAVIYEDKSYKLLKEDIKKTSTLQLKYLLTYLEK